MDIDSAATWLFVPGDREDRFGKASASGADAVIIDLQDAVAESAKAVARRATLRWLDEGGVAVVRINPVDTTLGAADLAALGDWHARAKEWGLRPSSLRAVMVPLAERADGLDRVAGALPGVCTVPLVETARGASRLRELCEHPSVSRIAFGNLDMALDLGCEQTSPVLQSLRASLVVESRAAGIAAPVDGVSTDVADPGQAASDARSSRRDGFGGKLCIHPAQVAVVAAEFVPRPADIAWAERVVDALDGGRIGVASLDGQMLDAPVIKRAQRILATLGERS